VTDSSPDIVEHIDVVRGYRGTLAASHSNQADIYTVTENVHHIRSSTNPTNAGSWAGAVTVGDSSSPITGLIGIDDLLYIMKTNGVYTYDGTTVSEIDEAMETLRHPDNFRGAFRFKDKIMLPLGAGGMWELDTASTPKAIQDISFSKVMPDRTELHGRVVAGYSEPNRMFILVHESANTRYHLLMGEEVTVTTSIDTTTDYRWHHMTHISYTTGTDDGGLGARGTI